MKFTAEQVARMLLQSGPRTGPLHLQLSDGLRDLIDYGELPPDALLPPERALAEALSMSRTTVVTAYRTLCEAGRLERKQGSGTRVASGRAGEPGRETVSSHVLSGDHAAAWFLRGQLATIDMSTAALPCLPMVSVIAAGLTHADYVALGAEHHGYHPRGLPALREAIARTYTNAGVPTTPDQIVVTSGAQQALELITHGCLAPGDSVVAEDPTYRGAMEAFRLAHARVRAVPSDEQGMAVAELEEMMASQPPRLVYVQSTVHNPTGSMLADGRRRRLARLAEQHSVIVVDDTALADTVLNGSPPIPLAGLTDSERILTIGSMSKLYWGGLRLGWIRGSAQVVSRLSQMKGITDLGTSLVSQEIAIRLLDRIDDARLVRREQLTAGLESLSALLNEYLPDWSWNRPHGGPSLWVRIPATSATNFAYVAARFGVALTPARAFGPGEGADDHLRLPYVLPSEVMRTGVQRLAIAWDAFSDGRDVHPRASMTT